MYNSSAIKVLEGLEAVRLRPGMYIGSTGSKGLHHLVNEIVDNSVDEFLAGAHCRNIDVNLEKDGSITVEDDGRGIPVEMHEKGVSAARVIFSTLHAGGKFGTGGYSMSGGLHGVGASVVNALSERFSVKISRDGYIYEDGYKNGGEPAVELINGLLPVVGKTKKRGTLVNFLPDEKIFETIEYKPEIIKRRLKELSYLNRGLSISFENKRDSEEKNIYVSDEGIVGLLKEVNKNKDLAFNETISFEGEKDGIQVEVAIQYIKDFNENTISYCNNINTVEGGTHVSGFRGAFTRLLNQFAREMGILKDKDENFEGRDARSGMVSLISVRHPNPQYEGQTKTKLGNTDARSAVDEVVAIGLQNFFDRNPEILKEILEIAQRSVKLRKSEEKIRGNILSKSAKLAVNGKLAACKKKNPDETELFIVEGDSAGGSAKQGRDRNFQAILPLKGKVLNVEKKNMEVVLKNMEITTLISTLGCGFGEGFGDDFDIKNLKYGKIVILTDADVDGSHIRTLLLTFFYRYMPELIFEGKVFIGMPPLYKLTINGKSEYLYDQAELDKRWKPGAVVQRYKGLGEMNPDQLWDTTLDPKHRKLKVVEIDDAVEADTITTILMGSKVPPRKSFIEDNATYADLDL